MDLSNPDELQRLAASPYASAWVAASAGSGKTKVLSDRVLTLLLSGTPPEKILCLTFTRTAAAEMSNRIASRLAKWATQEDGLLAAELASLSGQTPDSRLMDKARRLFARLLDTPGGLKIMTLHSFCQSLLKRFPLEAGVSPQFDVLDERGARDLIEQAQDKILACPEFQAPLDLIALLTDEEGFSDALTTMTGSLPRLEEFAQRHPAEESLKKAYEKALHLPAGTTRKELIEKFCFLSSERYASLQSAALILAGGSKKDAEAAAHISDFLAAPVQERPDIFQDYLTAFLTQKGEVRAKLTNKGSEEALPHMTAEADRAVLLLKQLKSELVLRASMALVNIGIAVMQEYNALKTTRSVMDYDDLISSAHKLLEKSGAAAWVLFKLDGGIDHILVDEAQDTSPGQWAVIRFLAEEFFAGIGARPANRTLFAVGDKKQSIYSFQGADPAEFEKMRSFFRAKATEAGKKWHDVPMYISFRSTPAVIDVVNRVLRSESASKGVLEQGEDGTHLSWRKAEAGLVEIWPSEKAESSDKNKEFTKPVERVFMENASTRLARKIALRISRMIHNKEKLVSQNRPIRPGDILILVKRRTAFIEDLSRELKSLDIPVSGVDRLKIASHIAVMDLMVLGDFLLLPEDDLALATVLRSPLCGISEEDLFNLAYNRGNQTLLTRLARHKNESDTDLGKAYAFLTNLLNRADKMKPYELYAYILGTLGKQKEFISRMGYQALDALDEFMTLSLAYDAGNTPSLQNFLRWVRRNDLEIKRDPDQKAFDAVRIMTVHGAKGLQAPVIFLPDTRQYRFHALPYFWLENNDENVPVWVSKADYRDETASEQIDRQKEKDKEEYNRLLYVALTRAADRLYICGWDNKNKAPENNWYDSIRNALSVCDENGNNAYLADEIHDPLFDEPVLRIISEQKKPVISENGHEEKKDIIPLQKWAFSRPPEEPSPPKPLAPSSPKTEMIPLISPLSESREKALRRGTLIHALFEILPKHKPENREAVMKRYLKTQAPELTDSEKQEIAGQVLNIISHPDFTVLFSPESLAEIPVSGIAHGRVITGQIDRLAVSDSEVLIIDYKSNRTVPASLAGVPDVYRAQMSAYSSLLEQIYPDKKIRCFLLWTEEALMMEITSLVQ